MFKVTNKILEISLTDKTMGKVCGFLSSICNVSGIGLLKVFLYK